jgi:FAD/FMN-containing dehydrogenase
MLTPETTTTFKENFSGEIILPNDSAYETAKNVFSGDGSPAIIVRPSTTEDVAAAIDFAKNNLLVLSVRGGGHHGAAFGTNNGGMVIDLSPLDSVEVTDEINHTVRIGGGAKWGDVASILHQYGLALSSGDTKSVGVGGLTLGGGIGWMVRKWGLALDSLIGAEIVTADGKTLHANKSENKDLFWAIRGGGGNFGIVTHFEFKAHQLGSVYFATIMYDAQDAVKVLQAWRDTTKSAPEDLSSSVTLLPAFTPEMSPSIMVLACFASDNEKAALKALEPLKNLGTKTAETIEKKVYKDILQEAHPPQGMSAVVKNIFTSKFSNDLIAKTVAIYSKGNWVFQVRSIDGAMNKIPQSSTAFAHRDSKFMMFAGTFVPSASSASTLLDAAKPWKNIVPFGIGAYANFISSRTDEDIASVYSKATYEKLQSIKQKYDPQNLFDQNYNIKPVN